MPIRHILQIGNPVLWERSVEVEEFGSENTNRIITDLEDTLTDFRQREGFGRAIAVPQIGELCRIIFVRRDVNVPVEHTPVHQGLRPRGVSDLRTTPLKRGAIERSADIETTGTRGVVGFDPSIESSADIER